MNYFVIVFYKNNFCISIDIFLRGAAFSAKGIAEESNRRDYEDNQH